jgi:hypothetical protein
MLGILTFCSRDQLTINISNETCEAFHGVSIPEVEIFSFEHSVNSSVNVKVGVDAILLMKICMLQIRVMMKCE